MNAVQDLSVLWLSLGAGIIGLIAVWVLSSRILAADAGTDAMKSISELVRKGAIAFLTRQYKTIAYFLLVLFVVIFFAISWQTAVAFIVGAACSMLAGIIGMNIATVAAPRTAKKCETSFNDALGIAFPGGAVMGLSVVSLGIIGLCAVFAVFVLIAAQPGVALIDAVSQSVQLIVGFSMGASSIALFARVGGGIYTKAADVGADLVGKVEKGIPEDDPRNPAVIADNVGDNVGDVAGMGADLYESYVGALISGFVIALSLMSPDQDPHSAATVALRLQSVMLCAILAAVGILSSVIGVFFVRTKADEDPQATLNKGMLASMLFFVAGSFAVCQWWYGDLRAFFAILSGLIAGSLVGFIAQYYTSGTIVARIADQAKTGPATLFIAGTAYSMISTIVPLLAIAAATLVSYHLMGMFGIALAALGMLALTGTTVAIDAYGPIADNAAGIAEMAHLGGEVRTRAERLDAVGNTTAAIGKGFAIGSAALTALALFAAYAQIANLASIDALNPWVISGMFIGCIVPFLLIAKTMLAVGEAAYSIVEEVRRQFREIPGLMEGKALPDSARIVDITTKSALHKMLFPGIAAVIIPVLVGAFLGLESLGGFLVGSLVTGVPLALYLANAGGAWDNAKKYIEEGNLGGKGSDAHKAAVIGDTVGDPFKDTSGPSINILLKLMSVVALVFGGVLGTLHEYIVSVLPFLK
jgi:K(+)-stimulated pyrophosphate-energized sodium pump